MIILPKVEQTMTFNEANKLSEQGDLLEKNVALQEFGIIHYPSICIECIHRRKCNRYKHDIQTIKKCNFYKTKE